MSLTSNIEVIMNKEPETLADQVKARLGPERLAALDLTPGAHALGGIGEVVQAACTLCAGFPQPVISAAVRVLQLCGTVAKPEDLEGLDTLA